MEAARTARHRGRRAQRVDPDVTGDVHTALAPAAPPLARLDEAIAHGNAWVASGVAPAAGDTA